MFVRGNTRSPTSDRFGGSETTELAHGFCRDSLGSRGIYSPARLYRQYTFVVVVVVDVFRFARANTLARAPRSSFMLLAFLHPRVAFTVHFLTYYFHFSATLIE